jgi:hypothetical protein
MTFLHVQVSSSGFTDTSASRLTLCWHVVFDGQALLAIDTRDWIKTSEAPLQLRMAQGLCKNWGPKILRDLICQKYVPKIWRSIV